MAVAADEAACLGEAIPRVDMKSVELQEYCSVGYCKLFVIYVSSYDMSYVSRVCTHLKYWERVPFWSVLARRCCHRSNEMYLTFMISFGVDFWPFLETNGKTMTYYKYIYIRYYIYIYVVLVFLFGYLFYHPQWLVHFSLKSRRRVECPPPHDSLNSLEDSYALERWTSKLSSSFAVWIMSTDRMCLGNRWPLRDEAPKMGGGGRYFTY